MAMPDTPASALPALPKPGKTVSEPPAFYKDDWKHHHFYTADQTLAYGQQCATAARAADAELMRRMAEALEALKRRDERNTCLHEETHRGGVIWTICDACGAQWADDEGGKPEWQEPPEWTQADDVLRDYKEHQAPSALGAIAR